MQCPRCERETIEGADFCNHCGERLAVECWWCNSSNPPERTYCNGCGRDLASAAAGPVGSGAAETPGAGPAPPVLRCPRCRQVNELSASVCKRCGAELQPDLRTVSGVQAPTSAGTPPEAPTSASADTPSDNPTPARGSAPTEAPTPFTASAPAEAPTPVGVRAGASAGAAWLIPENRVLLMTIVSFGLYLFYWLYLTWKQYGDSTGRECYPVWHALTLIVPIYNLFRIHAHMKAYRELMSGQGIASTISPGIAVAVVLVRDLPGYIAMIALIYAVTSAEAAAGVAADAPLTLRETLATNAVQLLTVAMVAWLLVRVQGNLNRYWSQTRGVNEYAPVGMVEILFAGFGAVAWLLLISGLLTAA